MTSISKQFLKGVGRHFVSLSCVQRNPESNQEWVHVFSGFVIEVLNQWLLITAGHVIREVSAAVQHGAIFDIWRLGDQTGGNYLDGKAIPFDFDIKDWLVIESDITGLDYAAIPLKPLFAMALAKGGIIPLKREIWGYPFADHRRWILAGIPSESVSYDGKSVITARLAIAPMSPCEPPPEASQKAENQFYACLDEDPEHVVESLKGMSGGPIFSYNIEPDQITYEVIGVQSAWYPGMRIVAACPLLSFAEAIENELEQVIKKVHRE